MRFGLGAYLRSMGRGKRRGLSTSAATPAAITTAFPAPVPEPSTVSLRDIITRVEAEDPYLKKRKHDQVARQLWTLRVERAYLEAIRVGIYRRPIAVSSAREAFVLTSPNSKVAPEIKSVLSLLDEQLDLVGLAQVPLTLNSNKVGLGGYATSIADEPYELLFSRYNGYTGLNLLHEVGHAIDHQLFGPTIGWGSSSNRAMEPLFQAIEASEAIPRLKACLFELAHDRAVTNVTPRTLGKVTAYYTSRPETFARAFAQWITVRSGDPKLLAELKEKRHSTSDEEKIPDQWEDEDFAPIAAEFEKLFADRLRRAPVDVS